MTAFFSISCDRKECDVLQTFADEEQAFLAGWRGVGAQFDHLGHILGINRWLCYEHSIELWEMWRNP